MELCIKLNLHWWEHLWVLPIQVSNLSPFPGVTRRVLQLEAVDPRSGTNRWLSTASQQMVLPYASSWEIGCKMPGKSCKARLVRRCLLDQLRFSQRQIFRGTTWLFCSSSPVNIRWSNKSYYLTSLALLTRWTNPTTATLFLRGNCSQPFFSSANSAVTVRLCQSVIFDNPSLYIFLMVSKFIRDSGR